eukprot:TRINITY_DN37281_c0_g1_i1.p1 TRINITY_DN37281_c0_g1~~TRINITY_DN37281_c0_g1_i1.p1  ORF type:complete len:135 (+),score=23.74 TRINITY_DN37281_c0_g1_i1:41-406(+)
MTGARQQAYPAIRRCRNKVYFLLVTCCVGYAVTGLVVLHMYQDYGISITAVALLLSVRQSSMLRRLLTGERRRKNIANMKTTRMLKIFKKNPNSMCTLSSMGPVPKLGQVSILQHLPRQTI